MCPMINDSDRREVARRLREGGNVYGAGDFFDAVVFSLPPLPGKTNLTTNPTDLLHQLADLIDRPTTRVGINEHGRACCECCGCDDWCLADGAKFCPHCGACVRIADE